MRNMNLFQPAPAGRPGYFVQSLLVSILLLFGNLNAQPNLYLNNFNAPSPMGVGQAYDVQMNVRNNGNQNASAFDLALFIGNSTSPAGLTLLEITRLNGLLAGQTSATISMRITIPPATPYGTRFLHWYADFNGEITEINESDNRGYRPVGIVPPPELFPVSLSAPGSVEAGQSFPIQFRIVNNGYSPAGPFRVGFYLEANSSFTGTVPLGTYTHPGQAAGSASPPINVSLDMPVGVASGNYYLLIYVDDEDVIYESIEPNNLGFRGITVIGKPELSLETWSPPLNVQGGTTLNLPFRIRNDGGDPAALPFSTGFYFNSSPQLSGALRLGGLTLGGLNANSSSGNVVAKLDIPLSTQAAQGFLLCMVDEGLTISESDEGNNLNWKPLTVRTPDLRLRQLAHAGEADPGGTLEVDLQVFNQGNLAAGTSQLEAWLVSVSPHELLASLAIPQVAAGQFFQVSDWALPFRSDLAPGNYQVRFVCDGLDEVPESNEGNNRLNTGLCLRWKYFADADQDGFGDPNAPLSICQPHPPAGYVIQGNDCNDQDAGLGPVGSSCDDGDPCTINDQVGLDCQCRGTFVDSDQDGTCDAEDICPGGPEPGSPCDDGNPLTVDDRITSYCYCRGVFAQFDLNIQCADTVIVTALPDEDHARADYPLPTTSGNCPIGTQSLFRIAGPPSGSLFPLGLTRIYWAACDPCGNLVTCEQWIRVNPFVPPCSISMEVAGFYCNDNQTAYDPSDDTYFFFLKVSASQACGYYYRLMGTDTLEYGQTIRMGPYFIEDGPFNLFVQDLGDPALADTIEISPPPPCGDADGDGEPEEVCAYRDILPGQVCLFQGTPGNWNSTGLILGDPGMDPWFSFTDGLLVEYFDGHARLTGKLINLSDPLILFHVDILFSGRTEVAGPDWPSDWPCPDISLGTPYFYTGAYGRLSGDRKMTQGRFRVRASGPCLSMIRGLDPGQPDAFGFVSRLNLGAERQPFGGYLFLDGTSVILSGLVSGSENLCRPLWAAGPDLSTRNNGIFHAYTLDGQLVELDYRLPEGRDPATALIEWSGNGRDFEARFRNLEARSGELGRVRDHQARPGWNYYRLSWAGDPAPPITKVRLPDEARLWLFPNPTSGRLYLQFRVVPAGDVAVRICDHLGRVVLDKEWDQVGSRTLLLSVETLEDGLYFARILEKGKKEVPLRFLLKRDF